MKHSIINLIFSSNRKKDLLFLLKKEPRYIDEIKELIKVDAGSIQPHIKKMKEYGLIAEDNKIYSLSKKGEIIVENMEPLLNTAEVFEENADYWKTHDLTSIPDFLLERIDELGHFELLEPGSEHFAETPKILMENMLASREIMTFVSYFHPEAPSIYAHLAAEGAEVTLSMTETVAKRLFLHYRDEAIRLCRAENSKLFISRKRAKIPSVIVTDIFLAFKLFETDGKLRDQIIMCFEEKALLWGKQLFQHCIEEAEALNEKEFL
jgi:predicted transcriptional regulator